VTGAMTRVEIAGKVLLVDCGIGQGHEGRRWVFPEEAYDVDAVLLTHGHLDHIGSIPTLLDDPRFDHPILATQATIDIARISLEDSLEMQRCTPREITRFLARFDGLARAVPYDVVGAHLPGFNIDLAFREAGHILGSASVEITSAKSRVIISGDLGRPDSPILRDPYNGWNNDRPVDVVVMESTYGNRDHAHDHGNIEETLKKVVNDAVDRGGKVLIPAFAIGRTQVLLYFLNHLFETGQIKHIPVALDTPMGLMITETYDRCRKLFDKEALHKIQRGDDPLHFEELFIVKRGHDSARVRDQPGPMIVIAGSGMCTGGRIIGHLKDGLPDERNTVLFVGHQAHGSPGRRIQEASSKQATVWMDGEDVPVRARIETLRGLSAHADRGELLSWVKAIPQVRRVALHHGDEQAQHDWVSYAQARWSGAVP
jgi:metallo-beta-lactamase family protein